MVRSFVAPNGRIQRFEILRGDDFANPQAKPVGPGEWRKDPWRLPSNLSRWCNFDDPPKNETYPIQQLVRWVEASPLVGYVSFWGGVYNFACCKIFALCNGIKPWNQTFPTTGLLFGLWWEQSVHRFLWNSGHRRWNLWVTWLKLRIQDPNLHFILFKWSKDAHSFLGKAVTVPVQFHLFGW